AAALGAINGTAALGVTRVTVVAGRRAFGGFRLPRVVEAAAPGVGNALARGVEKGTRPLTARALRETEQQLAQERPPAPPPPERPPARTRGFAGALSAATARP
ncbi:MAG: hypothetical protein KF878_02090, partial [Planctomycetes bacterium]|nr:hypothetical protein [Planctomycetota bacterium]